MTRTHHIFMVLTTAFAALLCPAGAAAQTCAAAFLSPAVAASAPSQLQSAKEHMPIRVSAADFLEKAYALADCQLDSTAIVRAVIELTRMAPVNDEYGNWLDSIDGFRVSYSDMAPEVSAVTRYDDLGKVEDFAFFFIFPYAPGERSWANERQADFSGALLQELRDMGVDAAASSGDPDYFTVAANHDGRPVDILLREDDGQYVLALHVIKDDH